jgi:hypothetical protein
MKLAGKALSKDNVASITASRQKYMKQGMFSKDATTKALEDFVNAAHDEVSGYETEIAGKGGVTGADEFSLSDEIAFAKGLPPTEKTESELQRMIGGLKGASEKREIGLFSLEEQGYTPAQKAFAKKIGTSGNPIKDFKKRMDEAKHQAKTKFRQRVVDQFASFKEILNDPKSWMLSQLTHSAPGAIEQAVVGGELHMREDGVMDVDISKKSLVQVLAPLGDQLEKWTHWMAANRANKLMKEGREHLFTQGDINAGRALNVGNEESFEQARKDFERIQASIVQVAVKTGLVSSEEADRWREDGFYLPFYRILQEEEHVKGPRGMGNSGLVGQQAAKQLKGGTENIGDLMTNVMLNWEHLISASLRNQAGSKALDAAVQTGAAVQVAKGSANADVFIKKDGQEVWYSVSEPLVLEALMSLNWEGLNGRAMEIGRKFKRALTIGVTAAPEFKIKNLLRDTIHATAVTDINLNVFANIKEGFKATKKGSQLEASMKAGGALFGESGYIHGSDKKAVKRALEKQLKKELKPTKLLDMNILDTPAKFMKVWDAYQEFGARLENVNRAADYAQMLARGDDRLSATFKARDHLDFTRTGSMTSVRAIAQLSPFLNARLQGIDKLARAAPGTMKEWINPLEATKFKAVIGMYSVASIGLYLAMKDDEDYKALQEWELSAYHHFKIPGNETMFRIPRPFEVGAIAFLAESVAKVLIEDETHGILFAERLGHTLRDTLAFNPLPQVFVPALEVGINKNLFTGRPIESPYARLSGASASTIRKAWTSETMIGVAKGFENIPWANQLSPVQMEHMVKGYLGWIGATVLAGTDMLVSRPLTDAPSQPATKWTEYPGIKALVKTMPPRSTKYTTEFYDQMKTLNKAYMDIRDAKKRGDLEKQIELLEANKNLVAMRKWYNKQNKELQKITKRVEVIHLSTMSSWDKRTEIDRLTVMKNRLTKMVSDQAAAYKRVTKKD